MKVHEVSGRTIEEAISQGLEELGVSISDVTVDIIEEGSKGLFGLFGSRPAKVRLSLKDEENEADTARAILEDAMREDAAPKPKKENKPKKAPKAEKPAEEKKEEKAPAEKVEKPEKAEKAEKIEKAEKAEKPAKPPKVRKPKEKKEEKAPVPPKEIVPAEQADRETAAGRAQEFLQNLTQLMGVNVSVAVATDEEGNVRVNMEGDTLGILIGRRGETLDALQYLTSLQVNKGQNNYTRVTLDTEGYRAKREEALIRLANRMANRASKTGRVSMEPMNPYERR
ncbi:MAG: Jag N-terminal domain-containing protein, partial [Clostridia bacterium]|nr:Jag N-terminal domain-containing protein [Clostridia bacterium]